MKLNPGEEDDPPAGKERLRAANQRRSEGKGIYGEERGYAVRRRITGKLLKPACNKAEIYDHSDASYMVVKRNILKRHTGTILAADR